MRGIFGVHVEVVGAVVDLRSAEQEYPLSRRSFWKFISEGRLPAYRPFGRKILLRRSEIDRVLAEKRVNIDIDEIVDDVMRELGGEK